ATLPPIFRHAQQPWQAVRVISFEISEALHRPPSKTTVTYSNNIELGRSRSMTDWHDTANRALSVLADDNSDASVRMKKIVNLILDENNRDDYISKDFFNVQQTAGGLPDPLTMDQFVAMIQGHIRDDFGRTAGGSSFDPALSDDDLKTGVLAIDENIRHHIGFLNGVVHQ